MRTASFAKLDARPYLMFRIKYQGQRTTYLRIRLATQIYCFLQQSGCLEFDAISCIPVDAEGEFIYHRNDSKYNLFDLAAECCGIVKDLDPCDLVNGNICW